MKIDIQPKLRQATATEKLCIELREINALYVFITKDGEEESVKFDEKSLDEFCQSRNVSYVLNSWKEAFVSQCEKYRKAVKTNIHPLWTCTKKDMVEYPQYKGTPELQFRWEGKYLYDQPLEMTKEENAYFKRG